MTTTNSETKKRSCYERLILPFRSHSMIKCSGGALIGLFQKVLDFCKGMEIEIGNWDYVNLVYIIEMVEEIGTKLNYTIRANSN